MTSPLSDLHPLDPLGRFLGHAASQPVHPAVHCGDRVVTYGELGRMARRLAAAFQAVEGPPRVLVYLPKGPEAYAAMFAAMFAGGFYAPVDLEQPLQRHREVLEQFGPTIVVSTREAAEGLGEAVGWAWVDIDQLPEEEATVPSDPHQLAYVIFTSGSTGHPKGVSIPRWALGHYAAWATRAMEVRPADRWSQHPNIAFDLSVLDIYGALCSGATLYPITSRRDRLLPADFIRRHELTIWDSVPSVIDVMAKGRQLTGEHLASLRLFTFCGEPLFQRHLDGIFAARPDVLVHNTYGPTEATVSCSLVPLRSSDYLGHCRGSVALGQPIEGMEFHLDGGPTPDEGELLLLGEQLAAGYWKNERETSRAFVEIELGGEVRRAYRTGDWIQRDGDQFYFVARIDNQVKIRGHRIELDEIDETVYRLGFGSSCTVVVDDQLHTFLLREADLDLAEFRTRLGEVLPDYEVPGHVHVVDAFPRNANDKVDRKKLAALVDA